MLLERKKGVEAKRTGHTLVATFHSSDPSLVWTFDLQRNHSFTVALQGEEGDFELGVTSPKGEFYPVARFLTREDAEEALRAVERVLMKGHCGWGAWILKAVGILAIIIFVGLLGGILVIGRSFFSGIEAASASQQIHNGVPLPADQVLRPPP